MDELVTVIIPVYNMRGSITRCVDSVTSQIYTDLQIIIVDDGSTDGSGEVCDRLAEKDPRVEVIHQGNGGLSAARNAGIDKSSGVWIAFVDSDDFVSPYYIEDLITAAVRDDCDIAICRAVAVPEGSGETVPFRRVSLSQRITGREASIRHFGKDAIIFNMSWGRLYKARLWEGLRFPEGKINEDVFVSHALLYRAGHIAVTDAALYAYVQTCDSIMRSAFTARRLDLLDSWQEGVRFFDGAGEPDFAQIARRVYCCRVFDARCICKRLIPQEREVSGKLIARAAGAYREAKTIRAYADCTPVRALAYRLKLFLGRWCLPLYCLMFVRNRTYI